jgi:hypothetical protein
MHVKLSKRVIEEIDEIHDKLIGVRLPNMWSWRLNVLNLIKALLRLKEPAEIPSSCESAGARTTYTAYLDDNYHYMQRIL